MKIIIEYQEMTNEVIKQSVQLAKNLACEIPEIFTKIQVRNLPKELQENSSTTIFETYPDIDLETGGYIHREWYNNKVIPTYDH